MQLGLRGPAGLGARGSGLRRARGAESPSPLQQATPRLGGDLDRGIDSGPGARRRGRVEAPRAPHTGKPVGSAWLPLPPSGRRPRAPLWPEGPGSQVPAAGFLSDPLPPGAPSREAFPNSAFPRILGRGYRILVAEMNNQIFMRFPTRRF